jgi:chemotaxis protein methyltransferase CheR
MILTPFKTLIKERCGFRFNDLRMYALQKGIQSRMSSLGMVSQEEYLKYLISVSDGEEFNCLVNLLTVNETYFYREPVHLGLLAEKLVPELLQTKKNGEKIRILSAGCSTGEEPYSIVMALIEKYGNSAADMFHITGVDIDSHVVSRAERGVFSSHSFRGFPEELKEKYFIKIDGSSYKIKDGLKRQVNFMVFNLLNDGYPEYLTNMDVVFYRNVSIYFESDIQRRIFEKLSELLNPKGFIIVSATETMAHNIGIMTLQEIDEVFIYRKGFDIDNIKRSGDKPAAPSFKSQIPAPPAQVKKNFAPASSQTKDKYADVDAMFEEALTLAKTKKYDEALRMIETVTAMDAGFKKAHALKAGILINLKRLDEAERLCAMRLETDRWCLESVLLLGIIAKIKEDCDSAISRFKEAIYISSSCWLAHFYLAETYRAKGDIGKSCREYEIAMNLIKKVGAEGHGLTFFPLSFPAEQIAHLCGHNLERLKRDFQFA